MGAKESLNKKYMVGVKRTCDTFMQKAFKDLEINSLEYQLELQKKSKSVLYYEIKEKCPNWISTGTINPIDEYSFELNGIYKKPSEINKSGNILTLYKGTKPYKKLYFDCQKCLDIFVDQFKKIKTSENDIEKVKEERGDNISGESIKKVKTEKKEKLTKEGKLVKKAHTKKSDNYDLTTQEIKKRQEK
jgi:hypothetical protein